MLNSEKSHSVTSSNEFISAFKGIIKSTAGVDYVDNALSIWLNDFATKGDNPAIIRKFCKNFTQSIHMPQLADEIYHSMYSQYKDLKNSNLSAYEGHANAMKPIPISSAASAARQITKPDAHIVIESVMSALFKRINGMSLFDPNNGQGRSIMVNAITKTISNQATSGQYKAWFLEGDYSLINVNEKEMSELLHNVYLEICSSKGPMFADQLLDASIKSAESLPQSFTFSPRNLL